MKSMAMLCALLMMSGCTLHHTGDASWEWPNDSLTNVSKCDKIETSTATETTWRTSYGILHATTAAAQTPTPSTTMTLRSASTAKRTVTTDPPTTSVRSYIL